MIAMQGRWGTISVGVGAWLVAFALAHGGAALAQSADLVLCDRVAADPADPDKPSDIQGVRDIAPSDIGTAIKYCKIAAAKSRRALYQLGRAYAAGQQWPEAVGTYRQSVLTAFAEVEDNLAGLRILAGQSAEIEAAVISARRSADLARKLYDAGRGSYLELLDAQRNLANVERNAVQLRGDRAITTVALIRALGGGWDAAPAVAKLDDTAQARN